MEKKIFSWLTTMITVTVLTIGIVSCEKDDPASPKQETTVNPEPETPVNPEPETFADMIVGVWNVESTNEYGQKKHYVFYFFPNGLFGSYYVKQSENDRGSGLDTDRYDLSENALSFENGHHDTFSNINIKELRVGYFEIEMDINQSHLTFTGHRKEEINNETTKENIRKLMGNWNITKNESFWAWEEGDTETLSLLSDMTYKNSYGDRKPYTGAYEVMSDYIVFSEKTGKDPLGRTYRIEKLTDRDIVLLEVDRDRRVYGER